MIRTQTQVEKLAIEKSPTEGWRCAGAWVVDGATNRRYAVGARTSVILSAGSIGSVQLLECSGIGDPAVLAQAGVEPLVNLPGVGENLQDHLQIRAVFSVKGVKTLRPLQECHHRVGFESSIEQHRHPSMPSGISCETHP